MSFNRKPEPLSREQQHLAQLLTLPENRLCADCGSNAPKWASFSIGYFVCLECSGIHRAMGTHITKVRRARACRRPPARLLARPPARPLSAHRSPLPHSRR
jgi:hypothetical protein